jgi:hypothetical protein
VFQHPPRVASRADAPSRARVLDHRFRILERRFHRRARRERATRAIERRATHPRGRDVARDARRRRRVTE